jgi:hypothetical protein
MKLRDWPSTRVIDLTWHRRLLGRYVRPLGARPLAFLQAYRGSGVWHGGPGALGFGALPMPYLSLFPGLTRFQGAVESLGEPRAAPREIETPPPHPVRQVMATRFGLAPSEVATLPHGGDQKNEYHPHRPVAEASRVAEVERPGEGTVQAMSEDRGRVAGGEAVQAALDREFVDESPGESGPRPLRPAPRAEQLPLLTRLKSRWQRGAMEIFGPVQTAPSTAAEAERSQRVSAKKPRSVTWEQQASSPGETAVAAPPAPDRIQPSSGAGEPPTVRDPVLPEARGVHSIQSGRVIPKVKASPTPPGRGREHSTTSGAAGGAAQFSPKPSTSGGGPGEVLRVRGELSSPPPVGGEKRLRPEFSRTVEGDSVGWGHPPPHPPEAGRPSPRSQGGGSGAVMPSRPLRGVFPRPSALRVGSRSGTHAPGDQRKEQAGREAHAGSDTSDPGPSPFVHWMMRQGGTGRAEPTAQDPPAATSRLPPELSTPQANRSPRSESGGTRGGEFSGMPPQTEGILTRVVPGDRGSVSSLREPGGGRSGAFVREVLSRWVPGPQGEGIRRSDVLPVATRQPPSEAEESSPQAGLGVEINAARLLPDDTAGARGRGEGARPEMPLRSEPATGRGWDDGGPRGSLAVSGRPVAMPVQRAPAAGTVAGGSPGATPTGDARPGTPGEVSSAAEAVRTEPPDLERIAREVYAILERRLIMERESRGL